PLLIGAQRLEAQNRSDQKILSSPKDLAAGASMYRSNCARCHGHSGRGALGPDLTTGRFRRAVDNDAMFNVINDGVPGTAMPACYWLRSEVAIRQLMGFVRSLAQPHGGERLKGDSIAGEKIFWGKGSCARCHMLSGKGARQGPDLSDVGWRRSVPYLRAALL